MGSASDSYDRSVLMLPWLAHGHISPYLELAKRLTRHRFLVYFCSTPVNLASLPSGDLDSLRLVELHLPSLPGLPPHLHTTKHLPSHLMPLLKQAFDMAEPSFDLLLHRLDPDLLIYDFLQPWAPAAARRHNIPAVEFIPAGAAATSFFSHYQTKPAEQFPFPATRLGSTLDEDLDYVATVVPDGDAASESERVLSCMDRSSSFFSVKTCREIEAEYIDYLSALQGKEVVPVGPLLPEEEDEGEDQAIVVNGDLLNGDLQILKWLNSKTNSSVLFASFGSEYFMSQEEIEEIAHGLERSGVNFIWVVRFPKTKEEDSTSNPWRWAPALPLGFMERVKKEKDRGFVIEGWAPQRKILAHRSTGGFLTHCGWSSVLEAMKYGVPVVALPMQLDQPINAKLVAAVGVGAEVKVEIGGGRRQRRPGFRREEVAEKIREVMIEEEGGGVRRKARQMAEVIGSKGDEEIKVFVEKLAGLCGNKQSSN